MVTDSWIRTCAVNKLPVEEHEASKEPSMFKLSLMSIDVRWWGIKW